MQDGKSGAHRKTRTSPGRRKPTDRRSAVYHRAVGLFRRVGRKRAKAAAKLGQEQTARSAQATAGTPGAGTGAAGTVNATAGTGAAGTGAAGTPIPGTVNAPAGTANATASAERATTSAAQAKAARRSVSAEARPDPDKPGWGRIVGQTIGGAREERQG